MLIPLTLLLLAAEPAKADTPKPKTAPLPELAAVKLQNNALRFELLKREMTELQQSNQALVTDTCKDAGFAKCSIDAEKKLLTEVKE